MTETCIEALNKKLEELGRPRQPMDRIGNIYDTSATFETIDGTLSHYDKSGELLAPVERQVLEDLRREAALSLAARAVQFWTALEE